MYFRRIMVHKLPPEERIVSSFLPVGPYGEEGSLSRFVHVCLPTLQPLHFMLARCTDACYRPLPASCVPLPGMGALALLTLGSAVVRQYPPPAAGHCLEQWGRQPSAGCGDAAAGGSCLPAVLTGGPKDAST